MSNQLLELPDHIIIFRGFDVVDDVIVWHDFFVLVFIHGVDKLDPIGLVEGVVSVLFNGFNNSGMVLCPIILLGEEGSSDEIRGVHKRHVIPF